MQRMEVIIRYTDDEGQVLSESNMSFGVLDVDSIPREKRLDQLESDTLDKGHEIMRHMFLSQCQLMDQQLSEKRQHSDADCNVQLDGDAPLKPVLAYAGNSQSSWHSAASQTGMLL